MFVLKSRTCHINTWRKFAREVRSNGCNLLKRLDAFPNSILVTGCQRSGTTILARTITQSEGMTNYWFGNDDELDAALILSGYVEHKPLGRYCFQTTYLNECYKEYFDHSGDYKIIWVLRNPFSVVYSMLCNWKRFALNELFRACGLTFLSKNEKNLYQKYGLVTINPLRRACLAYNGKVSQLFEIVNHFDKQRLLVINYDDLVYGKEKKIKKIYEFIDLSFDEKYCQTINSSSLSKADRFSKIQLSTIETNCKSIYEKALQFTYLYS